MEHLPFSGITRLEPGESLATDGFSFQTRNPEIIDRLLRVGAVSHRHDGHAALPDPALAPTLASDAAGGTIGPDTSLYVCYTLVDQDGGETLPTDPEIITTQAGLATPDGSPTLAVDHTAGSLLAGAYYYAVTITDGQGGETMLGPEAVTTIEPGYANSRVTITGLADLIAETGGTGWRLWRMIDGGQAYLVAEGANDVVVDDGSLCPDCSTAPPTTTRRTNSTNTLRVMVPGGQPAGTVSFNVYASTDGAFVTPSLLGNYPIDEAGQTKTFSGLEFQDGEPPSVSLSIPGAAPIDPDKDLLDFPWKRPVANVGALPASGNSNGDIREALDTNTLFVWNGAAWGAIGGGGGGGGGGTVAAADYSGSLNVVGDQPIPDGGAPLYIDFVVPAGEGNVGTLQVGVWIEHPWISDLTITLVAPDGTSVTLNDGYGKKGQNFGIGSSSSQMLIYDDDGDEKVSYATPATANYVGRYQPSFPLSTMKGKGASGTWRLMVFDPYAGDAGTFRAASLFFLPYTARQGHRIQSVTGTGSNAKATSLPDRKRLQFAGPALSSVDDIIGSDATRVTVDNTKFRYGVDQLQFVDPGTGQLYGSVFGRDSFANEFAGTSFAQYFDVVDTDFPNGNPAFYKWFRDQGPTGSLEAASGSFLRATQAATISTYKVSDPAYGDQQFSRGDFALVVPLKVVNLANMSRIRFSLAYKDSISYGMYVDLNPLGLTGPAMRVGHKPYSYADVLGPSSAADRSGGQNFSQSAATNYIFLRRRGLTLTAELWIDSTAFTNPATTETPAIRLTQAIAASAFYEDMLFTPRIQWWPAAADTERINNLLVYKSRSVRSLWLKASDGAYSGPRSSEKLLLDETGASDFIA